MQANPELGRLWSVGQALCYRDVESAHHAIESNQWSDAVRHVVQMLQGACLNTSLICFHQLSNLNYS